jgi:hypothetical protein
MPYANLYIVFAALLRVISSIKKSLATRHLVKRYISRNANEKGLPFISV